MRSLDYGDNPEVSAPTELQDRVQDLLEGANMPETLIDQILRIIDQWEHKAATFVCYGMVENRYHIPKIELRKTPTGYVWFKFPTGQRHAPESFSTSDEAQTFAWEKFGIGLFNFQQHPTDPPKILTTRNLNNFTFCG